MPIHVARPDLPAARRLRELQRRLVTSLGILLAIGIASTVALVVLGPRSDRPLGERVLLAFWDTLNLVSTVGSIEEELSTGQRLWSALVIIFGIGAVLYAFGTLQQLLHHDVRRHLGDLRMRTRLSRLDGHVIVCGYGIVGSAVAAELRRAGVTAVVVEHDEAACRRADEAGFDVIQGDATDEAVLAGATIESASGLVATLDDDASNTFLVLTARERCPRLRIVARCTREQARRSLLRAGADRVLMPGHLAGLHLSHLMLKPRVTDFVDSAVGSGELDLVEVPVGEHPWLVGPTLAELDLPRRRGLLVISVVRPDGTNVFSPGGEQRLEPEDVLLAVTRDGGLDAALAPPRPEDEGGPEVDAAGRRGRGAADQPSAPRASAGDDPPASEGAGR